MNRDEARQELTQIIADLRLGKTGPDDAADRLTTVLDAYEDECDDLLAHADQLQHEISELEEKLDEDETALIEICCDDEKSGITGTDN